VEIIVGHSENQAMIVLMVVEARILVVGSANDDDMEWYIENHVGPWGVLEERPDYDYESFVNEYKDKGGFAKNYLFRVIMCTAIPRLISLS
jgi:hypothetical protein